MGGRGSYAYPHSEQLKISNYLAVQSEIQKIQEIRARRMIGADTGGGGALAGGHGLKRCACCQRFSLPYGSKNQVCPICGWIDDQWQNNNPTSNEGQNKKSLYEFRKEYLVTLQEGVLKDDEDD